MEASTVERDVESKPSLQLYTLDLTARPFDGSEMIFNVVAWVFRLGKNSAIGKTRRLLIDRLRFENRPS
jgi:hypothetical protein